MRKHFLLFFLMSLLPLAGWAEAVDISGYQINLSATSATYTAGDITLPTVTLKKAGASDIVGGFNATWKKGTTTVTKATGAGDYVVTVEADGTNTTGTLAVKTKTFTVEKKDLVLVVSDLTSHKVYGHKVTDFNATDVAAVWTVSTVPGEGFLGTDDATSTGLKVTVDWGTDMNAGEHTFTLSADRLENYNVNFRPSSAKWIMDKKDLAITANDHSIKYGEELTVDGHISYAGFIDGEDESVLTGDVTFTTAYEVGKPAATYSIVPAGFSSENYNISYNNGVLTVMAKPITELTISDFEAVVYNKTDQQPTAITASFLDKALVKGTDKDYTLTLYSHATITSGKITAVDTEISSAINAGTYYVKIEGKNNFGGQVFKAFTIEKKPLALITKSFDKPYTGTSQALDDTKSLTEYVDFDGLVGGTTPDEWGSAYSTSALLNTGKTITLSLTKSGSAVSPKNVDEYTVTVSGDEDAFKNYAPTYVSSGKFNITPIAITVTALDKSKKHGETHALDAAEGVQTNGTTGDANLYTNWVTISPLPTSYGSDNFKTYPVVKKSADGKKTVASGLTIKQGDVDVTAKNYKITYVDGSFTEGKGTISVVADSKKFTYGTTAPELTATISGLADGELTDAIQAAVNAKVSIKEADHTNAGTYHLQIADVKDAFPAELLANYNETINLFYESATYKIEKAKLTKVTAKQQSLQLGDKLSDLTVDATTIEIEGLVNGDEAADVIAEMALKFATGVATDGAADPALNGSVPTGGKYVKGIEIDQTAPLTNYDYPTATANIVAGDLIVTTATAAKILDNTATATTQITDQVDKKQAITISTTTNKRTLYANQWNALVLPFDITPYEFTTAIGTYAVFDLLETGGDALNFKISIGTIPAYTPFLVKVDKDVDLSSKAFPGVTVKAINEAALTQSLSAEANYKFVGTVKKANYGAPSWTIQPNSTDGSIKLVARKTAWEYKAFTAYLTTIDGSNPVTAPVIYVEEPDGVVTAIKSINADGVAVPADGWYTLGGVKLQAAPTEKGVYIKDGKKFVIK